jgi:hypothetical protein
MVAEAWHPSFSFLNISSAFRNCCLFPFNPSAVDDRRIAPSKVFNVPLPQSTAEDNQLDSVPNGSPLFTAEQETLYSKRYEEGYDLADPGFVAWLKINHPDRAVSVTSIQTASSDSAVTNSLSLSFGSDKPPLDFVSSDLPLSNSIRSQSSHIQSCSTTSDVLSEILVVPAPQAPKQKRKAVNNKPVCVTEILEDLKEKEKKKIEEKEMKILEREQKKQEKEEKKRMRRIEIENRKKKREDKQKEKEDKKKQKKLHTVEMERSKEDKRHDFLQITTSDKEETDDTVCPKCGLSYEDDDGGKIWVCCDGCNRWYDMKCTNIRSRRKIPDMYLCEQCR